MVRRSKPPEAGKWALPGGKVRPAESLFGALRREMAEETAAEVVSAELVGWAQAGPFLIADLRAEIASADALSAGSDASELAWMGAGEVCSPAVVKSVAEFLLRHGILDELASAAADDRAGSAGSGLRLPPGRGPDGGARL